MLKEKCKIAAIALTAILAACSDSGVSPQAEQMLTQAQGYIDAKNPEKAIALTDSVHRMFPDATKSRRKAMYLRTLADSVMIDIEVAAADSTFEADSVVYLKLKPQFAFVKTEDMVEGYYIERSLQGKPLYERTGIEPRVDELGNMIVASCVFGKQISHVKMVAKSRSGSAATLEVPYDGSTNYRYAAEGGYCEMITFHADKCDEFCKYIANNQNEQITVEFVGKGSTSIALPATLSKAIADTYHFAKAMQSGKLAAAKKIMLAKKRDINRRQMEKTKQEME